MVVGQEGLSWDGKAATWPNWSGWWKLLDGGEIFWALVCSLAQVALNMLLGAPATGSFIFFFSFAFWSDQRISEFYCAGSCECESISKPIWNSNRLFHFPHFQHSYLALSANADHTFVRTVEFNLHWNLSRLRGYFNKKRTSSCLVCWFWQITWERNNSSHNIYPNPPPRPSQ